jgi:hypothetical protein
VLEHHGVERGIGSRLAVGDRLGLRRGELLGLRWPGLAWRTQYRLAELALFASAHGVRSARDPRSDPMPHLREIEPATPMDLPVWGVQDFHAWKDCIEDAANRQGVRNERGRHYFIGE